ncbi:macro domain-containing protein [Halomonas halophila]|uniref:macro domain-containing protein n=1 Tax=Halomonas halophila TaxID=29573 RepID=UPI00363A092E
MSGGGVAGALHRAAGPELAEACAPLAPIHPGEAVITDAFGLPNRHVIHCLGPVYGVDEPSDALLADCYRHALELAQRHDIESLAFPALSTGAFGYPAAEAARIALSTVLTTLPHCPAGGQAGTLRAVRRRRRRAASAHPRGPERRLTQTL